MSDPEPRPALDVPVPESIPDLVGWLATRATVRAFDPDAEIPDEHVRALVDAGRKAPTSGTTQMYSFVWVTDDETRVRIHDLCDRGTDQVEEASHFLVACIDVRRVRHLLEHADREFAVSPLMALMEGSIDASLAAQNVVTAAESRGYGVCPVGNIINNLDGVARELDLPSGVLPLFGLAIGVPADGAPRENCPRIPLAAVLHEDEYGDADASLLEACYRRMNWMYGDSVYGDEGRTWDGTLERYWGPDGFMNAREETLARTLDQQGFLADEDDRRGASVASAPATSPDDEADITFGVLRVLTSDDPDAVAAHGRAIEERYPNVATVSKCIPDHPEGLPSPAAEREALPAVTAVGRDLADEGVDALLISCTLDPALDQLSDELSIPVVGAGRSVAGAALARGDRVGTLTLESGVPPSVDHVLGDRHHATTTVAGAETTNYLTTDDGRAAIVDAVKLLETSGCDVVAPSCTGLTTSGVLPDVRADVDVPVLDPVLAMGAVGYDAVTE